MRKIFGALLILIGLLLTFAFLSGSIPFVLREFRIQSQQGGADAFGYMIGIFIGMIFFATINFTFYFFGFKLLKNKIKQLTTVTDEEFPSQLR